MLPWINGTAFVKGYTSKHKAWVYVKELEKLNVLEQGASSASGNFDEKKTGGALLQS
jgi:hypothetical protein